MSGRGGSKMNIERYIIGLDCVWCWDKGKASACTNE